MAKVLWILKRILLILWAGQRKQTPDQKMFQKVCVWFLYELTSVHSGNQGALEHELRREDGGDITKERAPRLRCAPYPEDPSMVWTRWSARACARDRENLWERERVREGERERERERGIERETERERERERQRERYRYINRYIYIYIYIYRERDENHCPDIFQALISSLSDFLVRLYSCFSISFYVFSFSLDFPGLRTLKTEQ